MKKLTKAVAIILLVTLMMMTSVTAFAADEGINPRLSHMEDGGFSFAATEEGGLINVTYYGYSSFVRADLNVKIEKRSLLVLWNDVAEWNASSTEVDGYFSHIFTLNGSGTYRATFTLTVTGNNGTQDVVTETIKSKY